MSYRRLVNLVALLGVLVHAGLVVRHNAVMLGAHLDRQGLIAALGVICHGSGQDAAVTDAELPWVPPPSEQQTGECPLCAGLTPFAVLTANASCGGVPVAFRIPSSQFVVYDARPIEVARIKPLSHGPPLI